MKEKVIKLKSDREELEKLEVEMKAKKVEFENSTKELKENIALKKKEVDDALAIIKTAYLEENKQDPEKKDFFGGFKVKMKTVVDYDKDKAVDWCYTNSKACLKIDEKSFKAIAKSQKLDWYKENKKPAMDTPGVIKLEE